MTKRYTRGLSLLPLPIEQVLVDGVHPGALNRIWSGLDDRVELGKRSRTTRAPLWRWTAVALALVLGLAIWRDATTARQSPLLLADGKAFDRLVLPKTGDVRNLHFADGSSVRLAPGAALALLLSTSTEQMLLLERGQGRFSVVPGGPRRWSIEAGLGRVEVVGTEFVVEREAEQLRVAVSRGTVLVRSALLSDGVQRLSAGQEVQLRSPSPVQPPLAVLAEGSAEVASAPSAGPTAPRKPQEQRATEPASEAPKATSGKATDEVSALLLQADEARLGRDFSRAERVFGRIVHEFPNDERAPHAAFSRGMLQLRQLERASDAKRSFQLALSLGAPRSLREDSYLGWLQAELQLGRHEQAEAVVIRYESEFPKGRHRGEMNRLFEQSPRPNE